MRNEAAVVKVLADPSVRFFAKNVLRVALTKDPVDAIQDLELVVTALKDRFAAMIDKEV